MKLKNICLVFCTGGYIYLLMYGWYYLGDFHSGISFFISAALFWFFVGLVGWGSSDKKKITELERKIDLGSTKEERESRKARTMGGIFGLIVLSFFVTSVYVVYAWEQQFLPDFFDKTALVLNSFFKEGRKISHQNALLLTYVGLNLLYPVTAWMLGLLVRKKFPKFLDMYIG